MQKCAYCGRENSDTEHCCRECGTPLTEPQTSTPLLTPHRAKGVILLFIWVYFAEKRRRFYLAGLFIGMFGAILAAMHHLERGFPLWSLAGGGALGLSAVWLLLFADGLQTRLQRDHEQGKPTGLKKFLFALLCLIGLIVVTALVTLLISDLVG